VPATDHDLPSDAVSIIKAFPVFSAWTMTSALKILGLIYWRQLLKSEGLGRAVQDGAAASRIRLTAGRLGFRCDRDIVVTPALLQELLQEAFVGLFRPNQFSIQRVGKPRDNFVLDVKQISYGFVETFCPQVFAGFGVDKLNIDPKPISSTLDGPFNDIANVQIPADLLEINGFGEVAAPGRKRQCPRPS